MSSLENALQILDLLGPARQVLRVGEVCRDLALPKSSVSRLLRTMGDAGLLDRADDGSYCAGPRAVPLAELYTGRHTMLRAAEVALAQLTEQFGFTGFASVLSGRDIVLLRVLQGTHPLRYVRDAGTRLPAARTAMGHVLLARLEDGAIAARFRGVEGMDVAGLLAELAATRRRGFILAGSVLTAGATTIAAAVNDPASGEPIALALAYPDTAVGASLQAQMTQALLDHAQRLEHLA
jgi:DNA-binding IclR family transcriptional regulator